MSENVLNLDELVGRQRPVVVEWKGRRYEMLRPESMTIDQNMRRRDLTRKLGQVSDAKDPVALDQAMNECLKILCPEILAGDKPLSLREKIQRKFHPERFAKRVPLNFEQKVKILEFYMAEVFPKKEDAPGEKQDEPKKSIGA